MLEFELDMVQRELDKGNNVVFMYCGGGKTFCPANNPRFTKSFKTRYCLECKSRVQNGINWLSKNSSNFCAVEFECLTFEGENAIDSLLASLDSHKNNRAALVDLVNIHGIDLFSAAYSQLISDLRDSDPDIITHWEYLKILIRATLRSYYSGLLQIKLHKPDQIYIFNGRIARYRPILRLAQKQKIKALVYEYPMADYEKYSISLNNYSHDIAAFGRQLRSEFSARNPKKARIFSVGKNWYQARSKYQFKGVEFDFFAPILMSASRSEKLPDKWNAKAFNLVFFISSQDELASIEENVLQTPFSQIEAIDVISTRFPNISLTVRIHPNLFGVEKRFNQNILSFCCRENVIVVHAEDSVNSYSLAKSADLVLTFGSTTGAEAAYLGKPVMVVGPSQYNDFGFALQIKTIGHLVNVIGSAIAGDFPEFPPKHARFWRACEYAWAYKNHGTKAIYVIKKSFFNATMVRGGEERRITASNFLVIMNRLLDSPRRLRQLPCQALANPSRIWRFLANPLSSLRRILFTELPS